MQIDINKKYLSKLYGPGNSFLWALLIGITCIFTILLYPNIVANRNLYKLGDVSKRYIKAPLDFFVEDSDATKANRKQAAESVLTVYDLEASLSTGLTQRIDKAFSDIREKIETIRQSRSKISDETEESVSSGEKKEKISIDDSIWQLRKVFEENMGISVSREAFKILKNEGFSMDIADLINKIISEILQNGVVANKENLLKELDKGIVLRTVDTESEKVVKNLKQFYGPDQAKAMVRIIGQPMLKDVDYTLRSLIVDFADHLISPNITLNRSETEKSRKKAARNIKPFLYKIKKGEMLLREGERVTKVHLLKLNALKTQTINDQIFTSSMGTALVILSLFLTVFVLHIKNNTIIARDYNKNMLFIASVLVTVFILARISATIAGSLSINSPFLIPVSSVAYGIPLASGAMTISLILGLEIAIPFAVVMAVCTAILFNNSFSLFIYFFLSSTMAAYWMQHCRERKVFIKAGVKIGLLNIVLVTVVDIYILDFAGVKLIWDWAFAFLGGIAAGIVTAGITPVVEIAFDYTTDIKVLEISNLDQPILRRLMIEAPGTYHHSVVVGVMVEAAASEIGANPLLARVCGYYHDIGKINKPLYFIENQRNGKNKHDKLAPSMSSLILIAHIKEGVEIARKNKLGQSIVDTIQQHHGTSLIRFFYEKAKQQRKEDQTVNIDDYRYPGPKPQTREAGLVMLADVVEAASKTLENPTPARIQGLVQDLINKIFSDGQLSDCELTLKDLHNIAKSFNKILNGIYHHRIEYSESATNGKGKSGSTDRQQAKQPKDFQDEIKSKSGSHLKRLGQS